jgi:uncharacterized membrane protein YidH (DUF202 family)
MICKNCGKEVADEVKICTECGTPCDTPVEAQPEQEAPAPTPPPAEALGGVTPEQTNANNAQGRTNQAIVDTQASRRVRPKTAAQPKEKSTLLLIAIIVAPVLLAVFATASIIYNNSQAEQGFSWYRGEDFEHWTNEVKNAYRREFKIMWEAESIKRTMSITGIGLLVLAIPTLLIVIVERNNKSKMIMVAGIVYFLTGVGIPSAILCFVAFAKK